MVQRFKQKNIYPPTHRNEVQNFVSNLLSPQWSCNTLDTQYHTPQLTKRSNRITHANHEPFHEPRKNHPIPRNILSSVEVTISPLSLSPAQGKKDKMPLWQLLVKLGTELYAESLKARSVGFPFPSPRTSGGAVTACRWFTRVSRVATFMAGPGIILKQFHFIISFFQSGKLAARMLLLGNSFAL